MHPLSLKHDNILQWGFVFCSKVCILPTGSDKSGDTINRTTRPLGEAPFAEERTVVAERPLRAWVMYESAGVGTYRFCVLASGVCP